MKKSLILTIAIAMAPALAHASVTLNTTFGLLQGADGSPLANGSILLFLADADGDGFGDLSKPDSWSDDDGDVVIMLAAMNNWMGMDGWGMLADPETFASPNFELKDGLNTGDDLLLAWFDAPFQAGLEGPGEGVAYGTFRTDEVLGASAAAISWEIPSDGFLSDLTMATASVGGPLPDSAGAAGFVTIPEPATMAVLGLGGLLIARRRRNA